MKLLLKSVLCVYVCVFKVGACIVNQDNKIVGIGYNGMPNGCDDDLLPWSRCAENKLDTKYPYGQNQHINTQIHTNTLIWHPYLKVQLLATGHKNIHFLHVLNEWLFRLAIKQHQTSKQTVFFFKVCHAELNAIMNKNSADVKGCSMYVALFPCNECAKLIIQAGVCFLKLFLLWPLSLSLSN